MTQTLRLLNRLTAFANQRSKQVTHHKIFLDVDDIGFNGADIGPLHSKTDPCYDAWEIRFDTRYFDENRGNPTKLKKIICHELAHIKVPREDHPKPFQRVARSLGAGIYAQTGMG